MFTLSNHRLQAKLVTGSRNSIDELYKKVLLFFPFRKKNLGIDVAQLSDALAIRAHRNTKPDWLALSRL
jgi:hypothetical protein